MCIVLFCSGSATAQNNSILFTYGQQEVPLSDFNYVYEKNNRNDANLYKEQSVREYLDLFINFKLKVKAAESIGLDTLASFKNELEQYRRQLAQSYLTDRDVSEELIKEAYEHSKEERKVSHILVMCAEDALPEDTLKAYNKALQLKADIVLKGKDFNQVARESSDDPSVRDNGGELGFLSAFQTIYPFERAFYRQQVGEISDPVRTKYGYHLIKVEQKRPSVGKRHAAHILFRIPKFADATQAQDAEKRANEAYSLLQKGEKFETLARQISEDKSTAPAGGDLGWFGAGKMVSEFEAATFALKNAGDFSPPFKTLYGWHIVKLIESKPIGDLEAMRSELKAKVEKDSRSEVAHHEFINKLKKQFAFNENENGKKNILSKLDSTFQQGAWKPNPADSYDQVLFIANKKTYRQKDFVDFLVKNQRRLRAGQSTEKAFNALYQLYVENELVKMEEAILPEKYPDFRRLMQEYRDGILLFDLTNREVWEKALTDSTGLKQYFEQHSDKYQWGERCKATIYTCHDEATAQALKAVLDKGSAETFIKENLDKGIKIGMQSGSFEKGQNDAIDSIPWKKGTSRILGNDKKEAIVVYVEAILPPAPRTLDEAKGYVVADYQAELEKQWMQRLNTTYPVKVNEEVLKTLIKP
ncbi:MAG: peptidylprolyl isomerase [Sphingobacteriales bacterium]|nr:peptidylprolyl isomerase [Sphingobacteriales bacterium]